jgi:hypothetical protein
MSLKISQPTAAGLRLVGHESYRPPWPNDFPQGAKRLNKAYITSLRTPLAVARLKLPSFGGLPVTLTMQTGLYRYS